jgi:hypothetical protein
MRTRLLQILGVVGVILAVIVLLKMAPGGSASASTALKTGWGRPRPAGNLDRRLPDAAAAGGQVRQQRQNSPMKSARSSTSSARRSCWRNQRVEVGTERDVAGAYNAVLPIHQAHRQAHVAHRRSAGRTSSGADCGRQAARRHGSAVPPRAPAGDGNVQGRRCGMRGGQEYGPPSPRYKETPPFYNTGRLNRANGPRTAA